MSAERPGAGAGRGRVPRRPEDATPVRDRRWVAPEQPTSPEDGAQGTEVGGGAAKAATQQSESGPTRFAALTPKSEPDSEPAATEQRSAASEPERSADATPRGARQPRSPRPTLVPDPAAEPATAPTARFPQDPASPTPRHPRRRLRRPQAPPRMPSVTAIWQRSEQEHRRFATRFAGQLLLVGAGLGTFLNLVLGVPQGIFSAAWFEFMGACALAAVWGLVFVLLPRPVPDPVLRATPAMAALLITLTLSVNHSNAADGMLLLTWPLLFAAYLLPRRNAYWTLAVVAVCLTVILAAGSGPDRFATWVEIGTSMALTLVVILRVRDQADRLKEALVEQASTDPLTGLSNRRAFDEALEREVTRQRRTREPLSLLAVDVDHFKKINDTWGHAAGDDTLAALGSLLPRLVRASDTVSRVGGEEFGVLLPDCPAPQARARADALRAEVWAASRNWTHPVTVSVGVATLPDSASALDDLVVAADMALYAAKESGRDRVRVAPVRPRDDVP